jgi:acetyl-CoA carboxylase carboxyltransferase component
MGSVWEPELTELARRRELAAAMGGEERIARQHATGRLTVRERIDALLDDGSFREVGGLAGTADYGDDGSLMGFTPANLVTGRGRVDGRRVVVAGDDFTVRGGAADAAIVEKQVRAEQLALELRVPMVRLVDGTGGGGSVKSLLNFGRTYVPWNPGWHHVVANLAAVPLAAAALGPVAGLGAARLVTSHFSVMLRERAQVFVAGPAVVEAGMGESVDKEQLGGWQVVTRAGTVDNVAEDEADALSQVRRFLSYLPANAWSLPPVTPSADDPQRTSPALRDLVPRNRRQPYDVRALVDEVVDAGSAFEIGRHGPGAVVTFLARLDGHPVGVVASDPLHWGGGLTAAGSDKLTRFVDLADTFHLPVVHLVDVPGFVIGSQAEASGTIRRGARALAAVYQARVPWASVLVRRVFGVAGAAHRNHERASYRIAWPSGDWGSLPIEGGLEVAFKRQLAGVEDPEALKAEISAQMEAVRSPFRSAEAFLVEDIVDPADTRPLLCEWVHDAYALLRTEPPEPPAYGLRP